MSRPNTEGTGAVGPSERRGAPWVLTAVGGAAMLVLLIGFAVWINNRDDDISTSSTIPATTLASATTTEPATTLPTTTVVGTTTLPPTTIPATTSAPVTTSPEPPPTTIPVGPSGDSWTVTSQYFPDHPFTLDRVAQVDGVSAYDGAIDIAPTGMRCVAIVVDGDDRWSEWCAEPGVATNFVVLHGIDPWLIEVGPDPGAVTLNRRDPSWTLPTNGCTVPMTTLIAASPGGGSIGSAVTTGIVCVPDEAFLSIGAMFLQPGPPDGGGTLVALGDEGWDTLDFGTSIGCEAGADGIDRCALYGVESELFEALLPIPPNDVLTDSTDLVLMTDQTATVLGWIGAAEMDPEALDALIVDELTDPQAEVAPTVTRASAVGYAAESNLLIVEVPAMDDSILSTTWALWISNRSPATVVRAYAWQTCARGLAGPDLCV